MPRIYMTKTGKTQFKPSLEECRLMGEAHQGFCLACGKPQDNVDSDAVRYECTDCGEKKVYGAEELALMGLVY